MVIPVSLMEFSNQVNLTDSKMWIVISTIKVNLGSEFREIMKIMKVPAEAGMFEPDGPWCPADSAEFPSCPAGWPSCLAVETAAVADLPLYLLDIVGPSWSDHMDVVD